MGSGVVIKESAIPSDTLVQNYWLPSIRAEIEVRSGHAAKAIDILRVAEPYELADTRVPLLPAYLRGEAHLAARNGRAAAAEFRKLLQHSGVVGNSPLGSLAHVGLARALALLGETANAKKEYELFFGLWKDADPALPVLTQAKAEYRALN